MDPTTVCDDNQLRNTHEERDAFARGWRLWVNGSKPGDCDGAVQLVGYKFAAFVAERVGQDPPRMSDAYEAAIEFLSHAPGCDTCAGRGYIQRGGSVSACPVCRPTYVPNVGTAVRA